jgi:septal ring factor EnvC (AmiA/AmiB activator)
MRKIIISYLVIICLQAGSAFCQSVTKLEEIRIAVNQNEERISELKNSMSLLQADLKKLNNSIKTITDRESKLKKELSKVSSNKIQVEAVINDLKGRLVEVELRALARIRALYKTPKTNLFKVSSSDNQNISRAIKYASVLRQQDELDLQRIHELRGLQAQENTKLEQLHVQQTALLAESSMQRAELETRRKSVEKIVAEFNQKKKAVEKEILALRSQELRLEAVLKGITGGAPESVESDKNKSTVQSASNNIQFKGDGFPKSKISMFTGKIIEKFGKVSSGVTSKGIVILTKQQTVTSAIPSKVSFVGKMPRIGTVVILDHGNRDYTLLGKLKSALVKQGDILEADQPFAEVDIDASGSGQIYLETRRSGKPINPTTIYKTS